MKRFALLALFALPACGEEDAHAHEGGEDLVTEACEHGADGPFEDVTAGADAAGAPSIAFEHTGVRIALSEAARVVKFEAAEATDYVFFFSKDVPVVFTDAAGTTLPIEATEAVEACAEIAVQHTIELPVGTAFLTFGASPEALITAVVEEAGAGHTHE